MGGAWATACPFVQEIVLALISTFLALPRRECQRHDELQVWQFVRFLGVLQPTSPLMPHLRDVEQTEGLGGERVGLKKRG